MNKFAKLASVMLISAAFAGGAYAQQSQGEPKAQPSAEFLKLDTDHDGFISREEAAKLPHFDEAFNQADGNRDGKLDADEFVEARSLYDRIRAGNYVEDSVITAKVKGMLIKDAPAGALSINVKTYRGTVLLSGFVNNAEQSRHAEELASKVQGVVAVKNSLLVK